MKISVVKIRKPSEIQDLMDKWKKEYGSIDSLHQKVMISKCSSPGKMSDYILWEHLKSGAKFQENAVFETAEVFDFLSPRRAELLEYLGNNEVSSIRELSNKLKRNYKNVYDDLKALSRFELVELQERGRAIKPCCSTSIITIDFED